MRIAVSRREAGDIVRGTIRNSERPEKRLSVASKVSVTAPGCPVGLRTDPRCLSFGLSRSIRAREARFTPHFMRECGPIRYTRNGCNRKNP
jgi:hypothetical protein